MATPDPFPSGTEGRKELSEERALTVGQFLRQERERKNISLEAVVKATRITLQTLEALERDDFRAISAPIFVRGFLRTYASYLGLDPKEVTARYESQIDLIKISPKMRESLPDKLENPLLKYIIVLCLILMGVAIGFYFFQKKAPAPTPKPAPLATIPRPSTPVVQPPPSPTPPSPEEKASPAPAVQPEKEKKQPEKPPASGPVTIQSLKVIALEKTWLRIKPDDRPVIDVLLQPRETASWSASRHFDITVGNAGGVEIFFNGVSQGSLGKSGEVVRLVLPKEVKPSLPGLPKETKPSQDLPPNRPQSGGEEKKL